MDVNNLIELNKVRKNAPKTSEDKVLVENSSYAITYNQQNSTYDLLRKIEKEKVLELIGDINDNDEIKASSVDVQKLAYEDAAQQMAVFAEHEPRFLTMPNKEVLDYQYNAESNQIEVGKMTSEGMDLQYTYDYDLSSSPEHNLSIIHDDLAGLDEFRMLSVEEIEQREKIALSWRITDNKLEMPSGDVLTVEYDKEKDTLNVVYTTEDGKPEIYSTKYNHEGSTTKNVRDLWQNFANMKQYQSTKEASPEKKTRRKLLPPRRKRVKFIIIRTLTCNQQMIRRNLTICRRRAITSRFFSKPRCMTREMRWSRATPSKMPKSIAVMIFSMRMTIML